MGTTLNKTTYILFTFFCLNFSFGQDTLTNISVDSVRIAYDFKLDSISLLVDSSNIEKRSFPKDFKEKYKGNDFVYEAQLQEKSGWTRFMEWLGYWFNRIFNIGNSEASISAVEIFLKIVAMLVIIFVIYMIVRALMNKEGQWIFGKSSDKKVIRYDEIEKNLHLVDFEKLIREALSSDEKRLAIRYYYLWLLKKLSANQMIEWDFEKTNSDYIYEIKDPRLQAEFSYLSYLYNYIWYGEFNLEDNTFEKAIKTFQKTLQNL